ncbi:aminoacyl-tRNA hydrolase [Spiroplasma endosymbiont of Eupeodes luniger]|uniref:aminoacyl-tRNA hydrolase n=1 Tax=Spiroplasma endosymbiont of Eupeodes luniger TaxID=3066300 RepID=UPI0030D04B67
MKLIVGLGNPDKEYVHTRHNIGFQIIDALVKKWNIKLDSKKMDGQYSKTIKNNESIILLKPLTYMNLSGYSVSSITNYFKIAISDIIVIYDDVDLQLGVIKLRHGGSSGGHNGINSIINSLNSNKIKRIKIGIGKDNAYDTSSWVLGKFTNKEKPIIDDTVNKVLNIIDDFVVDFNFERVMNIYN